jgi:dTDP-glucose pyrophosphorylase
MGSPADGKEMLRDPLTDRPLVDYAIELALGQGLRPIIIISSEKTALKNHIKKTFPNKCTFVNHNPKEWEEWPHSLMAAEAHWGLYNLIVLPDTRFEPKGAVVSCMMKALQEDEKEVAFATHEVRGGSLFGVIKSGPYDTIMVAEKPNSFKGKDATAWGLIGFNKANGIPLLEAFCLRGTWVGYPKSDVCMVQLQWFKDITRKGVVEEY